jgi:hypothetical protein
MAASNQDVRELLKQALNCGQKQQYIAKQVGINPAILSRFKNGKFKLYGEPLVRLDNYLKNFLSKLSI